MDSNRRHHLDSDPRRHRPFVRDDHVEATAFLHEIVMTADSLKAARAFDGESAMHFETRWRLLRAIERCGGAPTFTDLGRLRLASRPDINRPSRARAATKTAARLDLHAVERARAGSDAHH